MIGIGHIIVGGTGAGKSTYIRSLLDKVPNKKSFLIYDVNAEYQDWYKGPLLDMSEFKEKAINAKNCIIVFEEATIFFSNRGDDLDLKNMLVRKRHTKIYVFMVFHGLQYVPRYLLSLSTHLTLFYTIDTRDYVESKFGKGHKILKLYDDVQKHTKFIEPGHPENNYYHGTIRTY